MGAVAGITSKRSWDGTDRKKKPPEKGFFKNIIMCNVMKHIYATALNTYLEMLRKTANINMYYVGNKEQFLIKKNRTSVLCLCLCEICCTYVVFTYFFLCY